MRHVVLLVAVVVASVVGGAGLGRSDPPEGGGGAAGAGAVARDQGWLKRLVGEWSVELKMFMQPGEPPVVAPGTDSVRALGEHWVIADTKGMMAGAPFAGVLSLGYDTEKKQFHGTWIDSMGGHLWLYKGSLNEAGDAMTLETEGPSMLAADKMARYRETIRITGEDSRTFTSTMEGEGGAWVTILTAEYRRKK